MKNISNFGKWTLILTLAISGCTLSNVHRNYQFDSNKGRSLLIMSLSGSGTPNLNVRYLIKGVSRYYTKYIEVFVKDRKKPLFDDVCEKFSQHGADYYFKNPTEWISSNPIKVKNLFKNCSGKIVVIEIPPGAYIIETLRIMDVNNPTFVFGDSISFSPVPLNSTFEIAPNQILYIGNIHYIFYIDPSSYRFNMWFIYADEQQRDYEIVNSKFPNISLIGSEKKIIQR